MVEQEQKQHADPKTDKGGEKRQVSHALRNVMQGHRQHHHGAAAQPAFRPLRLIAAHMKVGNQMVEQEQKQHADPKSDKGGEKGQLPHILRLLNGGDQQAPDGRCHHHTGGKAGKGAPHQIAKGFFHKEHAGRAQCCSQERDHDSEKGFHLSHRLCVNCCLFRRNPASSRYSGCSFTYGSWSPQMV